MVIRRDGSQRELTLQTVPRPLISRVQFVAHHLIIPAVRQCSILAEGASVNREAGIAIIKK